MTTTPERERPRRTRPAPLDLPFLGINAAFVLALVVVGAVAAWPIYESPRFVVLVVVASLLAVGISLLGMLRGFGWLTVLFIALGVYLVAGVPLAVPSVFSGSTPVAAWLDLVTSTVFAWKELITIALPVGDYQSLLVPAFAVFLGGTTAALSIAWRSTRAYALALPFLLVILLFGIAFGSSTSSDTTPVLGLPVTAPREFLLGLVAFMIGLGYLLWRVQNTRRTALRSAQVSAGISQARPALASLVRRIALAVVIVLVAVVSAAAITPAVGADQSREVLRSNIDPDVNLREYVSPLSQYRSYFETDLFNTELFSVTSDAALQARVRLAVLSYYDGQVYRVIDPESTGSTADSSFVRVPYRLNPDAGAGQEQQLTINVDGYSGVWVPTVGDLVSVGFTGEGASALTDGFFYNTGTSSAIELDRLGPGDSYSLDAVVAETDADLASLGTPLSQIDPAAELEFPASLVAWVKAQDDVAFDGEGLATLIERLRARGYLSHAIGAATDDSNTAWTTALGGEYTFKQSLSGHSADRIGTLFQSLLDKQNSTTDTDDVQLVAAVGDDEQFAVAAALLAKYFGFPSRVVLGFELGESANPESAIQPCAEGVCKGKDLSAWIEVQDANGAWHTADVTPQYKNPLDPVNKNTKDPENGTDVLPNSVNEQQPPESSPSGGDGDDDPTAEDGVDLAWLVATLKIVGLSLLGLLIVLAPFITILVAKARRRKDRRTTGKVEERIVGGWDEYVDAALDHGRPAPGSETRVELAKSYESPQGVVLATIADRAVFGALDPDENESEIFWRIVEDERRQFSAGMTRWQRWKAAVSLRSFTRYLGAQLAKGKR